MLLAMGATVVMLTRNIDVSVGSITGLCAVTLGVLLNGGMSLPLACLLTLGTGLLAGANYLDFVVTNSAGATGNPAGLFVDFTSFTVVPEPSTYGLLLGAGAVGAGARAGANSGVG